jgi:dTDP-4-amino-4,6-dideoxygalactose transaminase
MKNQYNWPLATNNHSWIDRIKMAAFWLDPRNQWSVGPRTEELENKLAAETGYKYCIATSSGSTANTLVGMWEKHNLGDDFKKKNKVVVCAVGWSTTVSVLISQGYEPIFVDVQEKCPVMDVDQLDDILYKYSEEIAFVFYTTLLGFREPFLQDIKEVCSKYQVKLNVDSCEDTLGIKGEDVRNQMIVTGKPNRVV